MDITWHIQVPSLTLKIPNRKFDSTESLNQDIFTKDLQNPFITVNSEMTCPFDVHGKVGQLLCTERIIL